MNRQVLGRKLWLIGLALDRHFHKLVRFLISRVLFLSILLTSVALLGRCYRQLLLQVVVSEDLAEPAELRHEVVLHLEHLVPAGLISRWRVC